MRTVFCFNSAHSRVAEKPVVNWVSRMGALILMHAGEVESADSRGSKKGKRIVVVVDEAQNCEPVLEVLRMLSNFETSQDKLIHIILSGQPQLAEMLFSAAIEQLRQRISIMAVLRPLSAEEARDYIEHRLRIAGYRGTRSLFTSAAYERIAQYSGGIPRNINNLCFNALSLGYALKRASIGPELVEEAFRDLTLTNGAGMPSQGWQAAATESHHRPGPLPAVGMSAMWPPPQPKPGRGLRLTAGVASFAPRSASANVIQQYATSQPINISPDPRHPYLKRRLQQLLPLQRSRSERSAFRTCPCTR